MYYSQQIFLHGGITWARSSQFQWYFTVYLQAVTYKCTKKYMPRDITTIVRRTQCCDSFRQFDFLGSTPEWQEKKKIKITNRSVAFGSSREIPRSSKASITFAVVDILKMVSKLKDKWIWSNLHNNWEYLVWSQNFYKKTEA